MLEISHTVSGLPPKENMPGPEVNSFAFQIVQFLAMKIIGSASGGWGFSIGGRIE
jgi:hypothetical protein